MKHEKLFLETLDSLHIKNIYIEKFTPEQIFYQVESAASDRLRNLRAEIHKTYKTFCRQHGPSADEEEDPSLADGAENAGGENDAENTDDEDDVENTDDENDTENTDDENVSANDETSDCDSEGGSFVYESKDEEDIKDVAWDDSDASFDDILTQPADTVLQMLQSKDGKFPAPKNK